MVTMCQTLSTTMSDHGPVGAWQNMVWLFMRVIQKWTMVVLSWMKCVANRMAMASGVQQPENAHTDAVHNRQWTVQ